MKQLKNQIVGLGIMVCINKKEIREVYKVLDKEIQTLVENSDLEGLQNDLVEIWDIKA